MAVFEEIPSISTIKLPPRIAFDAGLYDTPSTFTDIDEADCTEFLRHLSECGIASISAQRCGRSEVVFQVEREKNAAFASAWDWAERAASDLLELEARRRAVNGVERTVWYKGEELETIREYSDPLLALLLKQKHRDFKNADKEEGNGEAPVLSIVINPIAAGTRFPPEGEQEPAE